MTNSSTHTINLHYIPRTLLVLVAGTILSACDGSAPGSDAGDIAQDGMQAPAPVQLSDQASQASGQSTVQSTGQTPDQATDNPLLQQDELSCAAEIDIADFFLTESDRQWTCEVSSTAGTRFDDLFFQLSGTANFASTGIWYWNRNLPTDEVNLAAPGRPSMLMTDIGSSNTVLMFRTISETGVEELYDCVLVAREIDSSAASL